MTKPKAITLDAIRQILVEVNAPSRETWNETRLVGYWRFCRDWQEANSEHVNGNTRPKHARDELDDAKEQIARLRKTLTSLRKLRSGWYRILSPDEVKSAGSFSDLSSMWAAKIDRLETALFEIKPHERSQLPWHKWTFDAADAFWAITGSDSVTDLGPAPAFIKGVLLSVYGHGAEEQAIVQAVRRFRADGDNPTWWLNARRDILATELDNLAEQDGKSTENLSSDEG